MGFFNKLFKRNIEGIVAPNQYYNPTTDDYEVIQGSNGAAQVSLAGSNVIQPVDVQSRYATTIQTHNAVSVGASGSSTGTWINVDGFNEAVITMVNDAATLSGAYFQYSHDGVTIHGDDVVNTIANHAQLRKVSGSKPTGSKYIRVVLLNGDAAAHIMSAWVYLKA
jgi:hypothetical protein